MHKPKLDNINSGFTLIETVIAIAIFAVIITSSLYAFNRCMSMLKSAKDMNIATSDIRSVCEQLRREVDLTGTIVSRSYALTNINLTEQVTIAADTTQIPIPVTATIAWQEESQRPRSISVDMLLEQR
ncbi:MAG: prepilin-type N-terminal cleavage/methylation domain-containing protein [Candidatus Orphnella occulta]|nr:prepilin-type N-terminal cleavage/methylation domain-containing protein [Candidatus Orphnella occulta]